jgi:hypothetical protein
MSKASDIIANELALILIDRHGRTAKVHADERLNAAREGADWPRMRAWHAVGFAIEKLLESQVF